MNDQWKLIVLASLLLGGACAAVTAGAAASSRDGRINLGGIVTDAGDSGFTLDTGRVIVRVDMDAWDWYEDYSLFVDETLVVSAPLAQTSIEQQVVAPVRVYADERQMLFTMSGTGRGVGEVAAHGFGTEPINDYLSLEGTLESVGAETLTLSAGNPPITVARDPLPGPDRELEAGSRVWISARPDRAFWTDAKIRHPRHLIVLERIPKR